MRSATIVLAVGYLLTSGAPSASSVAFAQDAPAQQTSQPDVTPASVAPSKPCPAVSPSQSAPQPGCKPARNRRKRKGTQPAAAASTSRPTPKVVYNGDTTDPRIDISPGLSPQQASQQRGRTTWLLGKTDENLKTLASRQLNPAQQDTVNQIKRYVEESEAATNAGDVQRAYTLANKARMLSGDLVKH
jgi:hypothetical protein